MTHLKDFFPQTPIIAGQYYRFLEKEKECYHIHVPALSNQKQKVQKSCYRVLSQNEPIIEHKISGAVRMTLKSWGRISRNEAEM